MSRNIKPKCRFCGSKVEYFGDLCVACDEVTERDEVGNPVEDFISVLTRSCDESILERMDASDQSFMDDHFVFVKVGA